MRITGTPPLTYSLQQLAKTSDQTATAGTVGTVGTAAPSASGSSVAMPDIGQQVQSAIEHVNDLQSTANQLTEKVASGDTQNTHKAVIAMEHALMALDFGLQVRNKMLEAYQEIMRTQV